MLYAYTKRKMFNSGKILRYKKEKCVIFISILRINMENNKMMKKYKSINEHVLVRYV